MNRLPSVNDGDLTAVPDFTILASDSHSTKSSTTEVEVGPVRGATGALVRDYNRNGSSRAYATVQTLHLIARTAPFTFHEQHRSHRTYSRPQRLHIHQRTIPTRPTLTHYQNQLINYKQTQY